MSACGVDADFGYSSFIPSQDASVLALLSLRAVDTAFVIFMDAVNASAMTLW
jgi:hypothetical protein